MAEYQSPEWHPAFEEYCETIFELREDDVDVIQARIAERLSVSRPAVSEMIKRMEVEGLVALDGHRIDLTPAGRKLAERVVRKHRLAERFLTDMLGLSWAVAHKEAGKWEHVISDEVEAAIVRVLHDPTTCPHGNPIPGSKHATQKVPTVALASVEPGSVTVARISEKLELSDDGLKLVADARLMPGCSATVVERAADGVHVTTATGDHVVPTKVAEQLYVSV